MKSTISQPRTSTRSSFLTPAMEEFLIALRDSEDQYAICEGREVWIDSRRFSKATLNRLLHLALLHGDSTSKVGDVEIWTMNEEAHAILQDPAYVPLILKVAR